MANDENGRAAVILPHDNETERNVLGTIINNDGLFSTVDDVLDGHAFFDMRHQAMFRCVKYLLSNGMVVDENAILDVARRFRSEFGFDITDLDVMEVASCDSPRTFQQDVERIVDYGIRRRAYKSLADASERMLALSEDAEGTMSSAVSDVQSLMGVSGGDGGIVDAASALATVQRNIEDNAAGIGKATVRTGYHFSDDKGGLRLGTLMIVGAFTAVGKTSLAVNIAMNMVRSGVPVAYYSLEMSVIDLWSRILNAETGIPAWKIQGYGLSRDEVASVKAASVGLTGLPLYIDDKATTSFEKMLRSVRTMVKRRGIKVFVVDYLQIFAQNMRGEREETALGAMARDLKNICRELDLVCIALSQLRRSSDSKRPAIDMLRGSGQIEESADNVLLIDRPDAHPEWGITTFAGDKDRSVYGHAELRVSKGRNIGTGIYYVGFDSDRFVFYEEEAEDQAMPFARYQDDGGDDDDRAF